MDWGRKGLVDFNARKTQPVLFDQSNNTCDIDMKMDRSVLEEKSSFKISLLNWIGLLHYLSCQNCLQNNWSLDSFYEVSFDICESEIIEKDLITVLKSIPISKSLRHDGLTKEFYEHFWGKLKFYFINSLKQSKIDGHLSISQRHAIIKLITKKDRDKRFVKN